MFDVYRRQTVRNRSQRPDRFVRCNWRRLRRQHIATGVRDRRRIARCWRF